MRSGHIKCLKEMGKRRKRETEKRNTEEEIIYKKRKVN